MIEFNIKLAGIPIKVKAVYESTKNFCRNYLTEEAPLFSVAINPSHIDMIKEIDIMTAISDGRKPVNHSDSYLETLALCHEVLDGLIKYDVIMLHCAAMATGNMAYLFTAKSGTGKTTHARLWLHNIPDCHILNGDKPLLLFKEGRFYVCGSPWMGKEGYGVNEILPLEAVCVIERAETNSIEKLSFKSCFDILLNQCHIPAGSENFIKVVNLIKKLADTNLYRLKCNKEDEAAFVSYNAMVSTG